MNRYESELKKITDDIELTHNKEEKSELEKERKILLKKLNLD